MTTIQKLKTKKDKVIPFLSFSGMFDVMTDESFDTNPILLLYKNIIEHPDDIGKDPFGEIAEFVFMKIIRKNRLPLVDYNVLMLNFDECEEQMKLFDVYSKYESNFFSQRMRSELLAIFESHLDQKFDDFQSLYEFYMKVNRSKQIIVFMCRIIHKILTSHT